MTPTTSRARQDNNSHGITRSWEFFSNGLPNGAGASPIIGWVGRNKNFADVPHPGYRKLKAAGKIIMGDMQIVAEERVESPCDWAVQFPFSGNIRREHYFGYYSNYFATALPLPSMYAPSIDQMADSALVKAYAKMNSSAILSGELLSDLDKSLGMLRRPFKTSLSLVGKMLTYRKLRLGKTAASAAKASSHAWLEYRYGWKPLIMDCESAILTCYDVRDRMIKRRLVARGSENWEGNKSLDSSNRSLTPEWSVSGAATCQYKQEAFAGVIYEVDPQSIMSGTSAYWGLQARDLGPTVWEILPYSFVADWFVGIGDWIQAVLPRPGIQVVGSWKTTKNVRTTSFKMQLTHKYGSPAQYLTTALGDYSVKTEDIRRCTNPSLASFPVVKPATISLLHSVDALALLQAPIMAGLAKLKH